LHNNIQGFVIPAKAGIQAFGANYAVLWIPAFAGMTFRK
jgi:hypothetical protein